MLFLRWGRRARFETTRAPGSVRLKTGATASDLNNYALSAPSFSPYRSAFGAGAVPRCSPADAGRKAGDEARTRDIFLGKEVLYQLSYARAE
jgi:hypothetical protein